MPEADPRWYRWLGVAALVVLADQITKWYVSVTLAHGQRVDVLPVFSWVRWHNDGAAFSILSGSGGWQRWFFVALAAAFTIFIVVELRRLPVTERVMGVAFGLILGGALGNMVDRLTHGYVVDFILVHYQSWYFPAFNLADISLFCGATLWVLLMLVSHLRGKRAATE
ncbi:MAG: signal peptidase II [Gammaproteobacteria bacterium]|jgi:signal peptidase II